MSRYKVEEGNVIKFKEKFYSYGKPSYTRITVFDVIKSVDEKGNILTETGIKLKVSDGKFTLGDIVFRGNQLSKIEKLPWIMEGKPVVNNPDRTYNNISSFGYDLEVSSFYAESEYNKKVIKEYEEAFALAEKNRTVNNIQRELKNEALAELYELQARNAEIRTRMANEEDALEQKLIKKYCSEVRTNSEGYVWCVKW